MASTYQETAYFITCARIKGFIMQSIMGEAVKKINIIAIHNLHLDISELERFANLSKVEGLAQQFKPLRDLLDLLLSGNNILEYLDFDLRSSKYSYVNEENLKTILEKYKPLGLMTKCPSNIQKLGKKAVASVLKALRD